MKRKMKMMLILCGKCVDPTPSVACGDMYWQSTITSNSTAEESISFCWLLQLAHTDFPSSRKEREMQLTLHALNGATNTQTHTGKHTYKHIITLHLIGRPQLFDHSFAPILIHGLPPNGCCITTTTTN